IRDTTVTVVQTCALPILFCGYDALLAHTRNHIVLRLEPDKRSHVALCAVGIARHRQQALYTPRLRQDSLVRQNLQFNKARLLVEIGRASWRESGCGGVSV